MTQPQTDRSAPQGRTQPGVQGADGRKARPEPPVKDQEDASDKGGQIAQDRQQSSGQGWGQT